jgi:hypothetical protein
VPRVGFIQPVIQQKEEFLEEGALAVRVVRGDV